MCIRMKLLALVLLLSAFPSLTLTEVVRSFPQACPSFFMLNPQKQNVHIIPTIFTGHQYKKICQRWNNKYRFATVYDTERRIPVYSAYTFTQQANTTRNEDWKIEPQLENTKGNKSMEDSPREAFGHITHQAVNQDYISQLNRGYTRGHVFPRFFAADQAQADSTFTLTNIAPQTQDNNGRWGEQVEQPMLQEIKNECKLDQNNLAYIVTGVVPGNDWIPIERDNVRSNNGINIPSNFWSAFCCRNKTNIKQLISGAYIAEQGAIKARHPSIENLNERLTTEYRKSQSLKKSESFSVFPGLTFKP
ncbi:endonuclease domain-containing 1 protein-like [Clarias gariepinus]|uniref:endonuclease domain-containing 1 protein-like n=1 Tax=Clarias gariepinus TaxID=13013 RepID=UPI00234C5B91|nr:endonuclease domain-containing 1 protein-like [Clarias gariepinus]